MAVLNRIVNILILVLVITAGVFSFMLYSKRENLTKGMKNMADAINKTAATLDRGSGTNTKNKLAGDALGHKNGPDFKGALKELDNAAGKVISQRDALAQSIAVAGKTLGGSTLNKDALMRVDGYDAQCKEFSKTVKDYKAKADGVRNEFVSVGKRVGANVSANDFANNHSAAAGEVKRKIDEVVRSRNQATGDIALITRKLGLKERSYSLAAPKAWRDAVDAKVKEISKLQSELRKYKSLSDQREKIIGKLNKTVDNKNDTIDKQKARIEHYEQVITDDGKKPMPKLQLKSDSPECFEYVKGKVVYVNEEYGFVQINIGKNYVIVQEYGTKKNNVHFPLQSGLRMSVSRGTGENAVPVAKILVKTVNNENSICNVIEGAVSEINVGDDVFFNKDDRAVIPAAKVK